MMRISILLCAAMLVLLLAACGTAMDGPTMQQEILHIQTTMPGTDWHQVSSGTIADLETERWENGDGTLFVRVADNPDEALELADRARASDMSYYLEVIGSPESTKTSASMLMGRNAFMGEVVTTDDNDFHTIDYVFIAGLRHFYVGAGARNSIWSSGGSDKVYAILDSMKLAIVK